jgi:hypothetical protein
MALLATWTAGSHANAKFDLSSGVDICIPVLPYACSAEDRLSAFGIPQASAEPLRLGGWVGSVDEGSSVNCPVFSACFHGSGTHTECAGHVLSNKICLITHVPLPSAPLPCLVLTVEPTEIKSEEDIGSIYPVGTTGDHIILPQSLQHAMDTSVQQLAIAHDVTATVAEGIAKEALRGGALVIRTSPNSDHKRAGQRRWTPTHSSSLRNLCLSHNVCSKAQWKQSPVSLSSSRQLGRETRCLAPAGGLAQR